MKLTNVVLLVGSAVVVAGAYWVTTRPSENPQPLGHEQGVGQPVSAVEPPSVRSPVKSAPTPTQPVVSAPTPLQASYDTATNLAALLDSTKSQADAGNADALRLAAAAGSECFSSQAFVNRAANFRRGAERFSEPERSVALRHNDVQEQRCRDLIAQKALTPGLVRDALDRAAAAGDMVASTIKLDEQWADTPANELKEKLRGIVASRDGEAIGLMATMLGPREEEPTVNGPFAGTQDDYIAWLLVACDLGRDCSASSRLLRELCLTTNRCPPGDYREYVRTSLATPQQFQSALVKEKTLLGLIADGRFQEIFP